jgi:hypothetical protein
MTEEQEDAEMLEEKLGQQERKKWNRTTGNKRAKTERAPVENMEDDYNYNNDESAIRVGGDGAITPPSSDEKNMM